MICAFLMSFLSHAQSTEVSEEYSQRIKTAQSVAPLGENLFGESVNYYTGETTFSTVDIDLPGNFTLPVRLTRRLTATATNERTRPIFAGWDLDVPYLTGNFAASAGWVVSGANPGNRCSAGFAPPNAAGTYRTWSPNVYWRGISMAVNGGRQALLKSSALPRPTDGVTSALVTAQNWQIRCLSTLANASSGFSGEGFLALAPDGTKYYFDWMVSPMTIPALKRLRPPPAGASGNTVYFETLGRVEIRIYATKVVDRFGNSVTYTWSGDQLRAITASDGRQISLTQNGNGSETATANGKVWTYTAGRVELPDHTAWNYNGTLGAAVYYSDLPSNRPRCDSLGVWLNGPNQTQQLTVVHPSGAVGVFKSKLIRRGRTLVWNECSYDTQSPYADTSYGPMMNSDNYALVSKTISGPGLNPQTWAINYSPVGGSTGGDLGGTPNPPPADNEREHVTLMKPDGSTVLYTFGTRYFVDEGKLVRVQTFAPNGAQVQDVQNSYALNPTNPPYSRVAGSSGPVFADDFAETYRTPRTQTITYVNGDTFTNSVNSFDAFVREVSVTRSNSTGSTRTDITAYYDNQSRWVLGQTKSRTNSDTGMVESATDYDPTYDKPSNTYSFGLLQSSMKYNTDGTLASISNGMSETTKVDQWKRGVPQLITFPDLKTQSAEIDDNGLVRSVTDELLNKIGYDYDPAGRLQGMTWPSGDTVAWAPKTITYVQLTSSELGVAAGSWRMRLNEGTHQRSVYFDARMNPILEEERDTSIGVVRYVAYRYDFEGRVVFKSYPSSSSSPVAGILTTYDTLGRARLIQTTDGIALSKVDYVFGNKKQVTDASKNVTTTSFQAFDQPAYDKPLTISAPESQTTTFARNVFGEVLSATRSGAGVSITETNTYDSYHRLCKVIRPESGQKIVAFDLANRITWSASGITVGSASASDCSYSIVPASEKTLYSYDKRGRLTGINYADSSGDVTRSYDDAGHLTSVKNPTATWTYGYNKRGLVESQKIAVSALKNFSMSTVYDSLGHVASEIFPDGFNVAYAPNAWGEDTQVGSFARITNRHPTGTIQLASFGNGLLFSTTLDSRQRLDTQVVGTLQSFKYGYNDDSQIISVNDQVDGADSATFSYDGLHRLKTAMSNLWGSYSYGYDAIGNLKARAGNNSLTYDYDVTNRLKTVSGAAVRTYDYDNRARVTSDGRYTFNWNQADQITGVKGGATYSYDGNGKRAKVALGLLNTEYAFYDISGKLRATIKGSNKVDYIDLEGKPFIERSSSGAVTYLHTDWLGSPRLATDTTGGIVWREHFDPYGKKLNGVTEKRGYTGHAYDQETGMTYMLARYYDAEVGRFLMTDPIGSKDDLNLYAYVHGDPINETDPTGTCSPSDHLCDGGSDTFEVGSAGLPGPKDKPSVLASASSGQVASDIDSEKEKPKLTEIQDRARDNPKFQAKNGNTFCNLATCSIAKDMGAPMKDLVDGKGSPLNANQIAKNLSSSTDYKSVSRDEAQRLANNQVLVIGAFQNSNGHGHVVTVRPEGIAGDPVSRGGKGPLLNDIGIFDRVQRENYAFPKSATVIYYTPIQGNE